MPNDQSAQIARTSFVLAVHNIEDASRYWCDVLGFTLERTIPGWRFVTRDICRVMLGECPEAMAPKDLGDHSYFGYIEVSDVDAYHREIASRSAMILFAPADKPWGMREMAVRTPDGHRVMFAEPCGPSN